MYINIGANNDNEKTWSVISNNTFLASTLVALPVFSLTATVPFL